MRKFKFRIWDKRNLCFCNDLLIRNEGCSPLCINPNGLLSTSFYEKPERSYFLGHGIITIQNQNDFVIQQFTSFIDRNGKEIYEGDIVYYIGDDMAIGMRYKPRYAQIYWGENGFYIKGKNIDWHLNEMFCKKSIEIKGNIFENQDLLNEKI